RKNEQVAKEQERVARERERSLLMLQARERLACPSRPIGWSKEFAKLIEKASVIRNDIDVRDEVATSLAGLDARPAKKLSGFAAGPVAFHRDARWVLVGGCIDEETQRPVPARVWNSRTDEVTVSPHSGPGAVAFRGDVPVQLVLPTSERPTF